MHCKSLTNQANEMNIPVFWKNLINTREALAPAQPGSCWRFL